MAAPLRRFAELIQVSALTEAPRAVLVNDAGDHVALDLGTRYELRDATGKVVAHGAKPQRQPLVLGAKSVFVGDQELDLAGKGWSATWPDARTLSLASNDADLTWALRITATNASHVVQKAPRGTMGHAAGRNGTVVEVFGTTPETMELSVGRFVGTQPSSYRADATASLTGAGCAAIGEDGRIVVAMRDRRFLAFAPRAPAGSGTLEPVATAQLPLEPSNVSIVDAGVALTGTAQGSALLLVVDASGKEAWRVTLPFSVDSPAIDGGRGRLYVAGAGLAAVEAGKVLWSQPITGRVLATALADGTVLAAAGPELRVMSRDGAVLRSLRVPEGDAIVAPPAVSGDGTAWLATAKGLYLAR